MKTLIGLFFALCATCVCSAQECVRYVTPYNSQRLCETFYTVTCRTGVSHQCGNPSTLEICEGKLWKFHGDDYDQEKNEIRSANFNEEGRELDDGNPTSYVCSNEGQCFCEWEATYFQCQSDIDNPAHEDVVDWVGLTNVQCFGS